MLWARYVSIPTGRLAQISRFLLRTVRLMKTVHCQCVRCSAKMPNSGSTSLDFGITSQLDWSNKIITSCQWSSSVSTVHCTHQRPSSHCYGPHRCWLHWYAQHCSRRCFEGWKRDCSGTIQKPAWREMCKPAWKPHHHPHPAGPISRLSDRNIENGSFKDSASAASVLFLMCSSEPIGFAENCHQIIANLTKQPCPVPFAKKQLPIVAGTARGSVKCAIRCGSMWRPKAKCWPSVVWRHRAA